MIVVVTDMVGIVTGMVAMLTRIGKHYDSVVQLELLCRRVEVITGVVVDGKFGAGVFVVTEESMTLARISFIILIAIMLVVFSLSRLL